MNRYNIDSCALLVEFNASVWTARKLDKSATDEVVISKRAGAKDAARVNKHLLAGRDELDVIQKFMDFNDRMGKLEEEFVELVNDFVQVYPSLITAQAMALGDMFDRNEYPSAGEMSHKFSFRLNFMPVPKAGDFRVDVGNEAQEELQKKLAKLADERIELAMKDARERLKSHLERMMERLKVEEVNGKVTKSRIHHSLVDGGLELCDVLKALNLTGDPVLEKARATLESVLRTVDVDDLRKHDSARVEVRTQVAEIMDKFNF